MSFALEVLAALVVLAALLGSRVRAIDFIVCGLPIATVVGSTLRANLSVADVFLPFALIAVLMEPHGPAAPRHVASRQLSRWILYGASVSVAMLAGLFIRVMQSESTNLTYGLEAVVKLWTCYGYLAVFTVYGIKLFQGGDRLLLLWVQVSCVAALAGVLGVALYSLGRSNPLVYAYRAKAGFDDPNLFASYLLLGISLAFVANSRGLLKRPTLTVGVLTLALILTGSRAAIPALAAGVVAAFVLGRGSFVMRRVIPWFGLLGAGFALAAWQLPGLLGLDALSRVATASNTVEDDGRITLWRVAWEMWLDHPVFGVGIGQYITASSDYVVGGLENIPHSSHLSLLAETGAIGYALVMGLPLSILVRVARLAKLQADSAPTWMLVGIAGSLAMAWTLNLENSRMLWSFLGICMGYCICAARGTLTDPASASQDEARPDMPGGRAHAVPATSVEKKEALALARSATSRTVPDPLGQFSTRRSTP